MKKLLEKIPQGGNPKQTFGRRIWRGLTPPTHAYVHRGGVREATGVPEETETVPEMFFDSGTRGEPLAKFWPPVTERHNPPTHAYMHRGRGGGWRRFAYQQRLQQAKINLKIWKIGGNP